MSLRLCPSCAPDMRQPRGVVDERLRHGVRGAAQGDAFQVAHRVLTGVLQAQARQVAWPWIHGCTPEMAVVPPNSAERASTAAVAPWSAAVQAATSPAPPEPTTTS